jgi:phosphate transport system substrate-binding protein
LIYDQQTRKAIDGLTVLPVDLNGNGRINDEEKFYSNVDQVIERLEKKAVADIKNVPIEYFHLSVDKQTVSQEAIDFLKWVSQNGKSDLHDYGFLLPETKNAENEKFNEFASKRKAK